MMSHRLRRTVLTLVGAVLLAGCGTQATAGTWTKVRAAHPPFVAVACTGARSISCVLTTGAGAQDLFDGHGFTADAATAVPLDPGCRAADDCAITTDCPNASQCVAVDGNGNAFSRIGGRWTPPDPADAGDCRQTDSDCSVALSCADGAFCRALDSNGYEFDYVDQSWTRARPVAGNPEFQALACPARSFCVAIDMDYDLYVNRGSGWKPAGELFGNAPQGGSEPPVPQSISCTGPKFCVVVDNFGQYYAFDGSGWTSGTSFSGIENSPDSVSCGVRFCVLDDESGDVFVLDGSGSPQRLIDGKTAIVAASCPSSTLCVGLDRAGGALLDQLNG